ncbi:CCA tRNA nucleotidyltransferase [Haloferax mediterranei ATCC 33500]|uniref:CCA-adding enzyme n=1 Tax=Haloferax mediterranei (strain ATCC 33500 / DSM 1411 / JCM 8866 / NBRC 14739 / NCIMB 2177 / R-4) TaxID=523841 RepID=I3R1W6_HALMT|nr:CCA tRNA nucleotidyltransferase [Haloferax mediterranei]AFK18226.1 tRNA CCA-pyrophosphorylase [Haloferax mediterranei ATCC 33500]AHZ22373.1 tRNA CCA-pyrophosphorylase [Haloferax mediterranei ATCC 33500]EMA02503.1 tRNA CCA-pyrophosphorylase [Haloferax mediterranei ATCC 33500]MDX5988314.1 CCA tRNA nucleotidyltransferase [Haloferax mediterranei ATCC 33500]QCQ74749.1 CCA tRNA nucleotidyltransferase [Haloferax mediterranei ATCC 33500]
MTNSDLAAVVAAVRERIDPDEEERRALAEAAAELESRVHDALAELPVEADVLQVGSTARGTWLSGDRDIDLFVRFPDDLDREQLAEYGLEVGHAVLPDGHEEYAEHPYVKGDYDGFDVDLVPCYDVPTASDIRSAVDRTPFHNEYLVERLDDDLAADVRVFKRFLKGIGAYGSDLRTEGFSGYLAELLVLEHDGFEPLLQAATDWHPQVEFDPEDHGTRTFSDPLVVIDPTDPERNVAAVCSAANVARLQHYARDLLADPREDLFFQAGPPALDAEAIRSHLDRRGTTPAAVVFDAPDLVDDQLYPQLRKSLDGIADELDRRGFDVFRTELFAADDDAVLFVELSVAERPAVERHVGPPVHVRQHAEGFYGAYENGNGYYGPFLDGDRYVVEREREFTSATKFLTSDALFDVALGKHVESTLREDGYDVLVGDEVATLAATFGAELGRYFDPRP